MKPELTNHRIFSFICLYIKSFQWLQKFYDLGLEKWLSGQEQMLPFQMTQLEFKMTTSLYSNEQNHASKGDVWFSRSEHHQKQLPKILNSEVESDHLSIFLIASLKTFLTVVNN